MMLAKNSFVKINLIRDNDRIKYDANGMLIRKINIKYSKFNPQRHF